MPKGRSQAVIYAVVLRAHPGIVKLGRTTKWSQRRRAYDGWNLSAGDGIAEAAVYCITEEYVDLAAVEAACLGAIDRPLVRGSEWFRAEMARARETIESVLNGAGLSFFEIGADAPAPLLSVVPRAHSP
jgi:hypothetical protein